MTDPLDPTPFYEQVAALLAARIESGEFQPRDLLPSEGAIQREYGVARGTARKALELLRQRGLVVTIPQRGSYVADRPA